MPRLLGTTSLRAVMLTGIQVDDKRKKTLMCNKVKFNNKGKEIAFIINNV